MIRFLATLFICLCATSAFATFEIIDPVSIGASDTFDSTSGGTKPTILTDQDEATYIFRSNSTGTDIYNIGDLTATDIETIDSVIIHYKAQDNGAGNNRVRIDARIKDDITQGSAISLTTSWVDYSESFTTPPGSRGTWDDFEVDSLLVQIVCTAINSAREVRVAECSVVVWYSSNGRTLMYPQKDDACLAGTNYDHDLLRKSAMLNDTAFTFVANGSAANDYWKSGDASTAYHKMNNDDWETGGFGIFLDVIHVKADCSLGVRIQRYNSSCVLQESTPFYPASGAEILVDTTGHYEIQIPQYDWSSGACGDELVVNFQWSNALFEADDSVWVLYGSADTYFEHEITINSSGCPSEEGSGDCAGQPTTDTVGALPDQEGALQEFINVGGADKITSISDDVDANYMMEDAQNQQQEVQFAAISEPGDFSQYDSISVIFRAKKDALGGGRTRIRTQLQDSTDITKECNDVYSNINQTAFVDFEPLTVSGLPSGTDACEGSITTAGINTLEAKFTVLNLPSGKEVWVTSVDLIICYTMAGDEQNFRKIRMIKMGKLDDKTIWDTYFDQALVIKDEYETSVTFGMPSKKWMWSKS